MLKFDCVDCLSIGMGKSSTAVWRDFWLRRSPEYQYNPHLVVLPEVDGVAQPGVGVRLEGIEGRPQDGQERIEQLAVLVELHVAETWLRRLTEYQSGRTRDDEEHRVRQHVEVGEGWKLAA